MASADRHELNAGDLTAETIAGDAVILNLASGVYYGLQGAGALAFAMLEAGLTTDEVAAALADRFEVEADTARADAEALLTDLLDEGILRTSADGSTPRPIPEDAAPPPGTAYETPALDRYDDMGELLALDPPMPGVADTPWQAPRT